jgi:hypothetical protein
VADAQGGWACKAASSAPPAPRDATAVPPCSPSGRPSPCGHRPGGHCPLLGACSAANPRWRAGCACWLVHPASHATLTHPLLNEGWHRRSHAPWTWQSPPLSRGGSTRPARRTKDGKGVWEAGGGRLRECLSGVELQNGRIGRARAPLRQNGRQLPGRRAQVGWRCVRLRCRARPPQPPPSPAGREIRAFRCGGSWAQLAREGAPWLRCGAQGEPPGKCESRVGADWAASHLPRWQLIQAAWQYKPPAATDALRVPRPQA